MSQDVTLDHVTMRFGDFTAVNDMSLTIKAGEFFSFLGPSGCGKTTILRIISGFMEPSSGTVRIGAADMRGIGPNQRPTALIFQNLALFPLMKVWENIAFGLEVRGVSKPERRKKAEALLDLVAMPDAADKRISELSGGQKQRVAIARALAVEPQVMLLDEPLSALDLKLRQHMRAELRAIQRRTGVTFIYITHDQGEALTMSDRIAVMSQGVIEQTGTPADIYNTPATAYVATFVGENNALPGVVAALEGNLARVETGAGPVTARNVGGLAIGAAAMVFVRPEQLKLNAAPEGQNRLRGQITHFDFEGNFANVFLRGPQGQPLMLQAANDGGLPGLEVGAKLDVSFAPDLAVALAPGEMAKE